MHNIRYRRIVVKIGSSSLTHASGNLDFKKIDRLAMVLSDLKNQGHEIILVSSGAVAAGRAKLQMQKSTDTMKQKQAAASVGQCELMFLYDKFFSQYGQIVAQLLLTKTVLTNDSLRENAVNTLSALLEYGVIPIVNENDSVAVDEIAYGDNDTLSAVTASIIHADLLILLSDIDGLYDDDPCKNPNANFIEEVTHLDASLMQLAKDTSSNVGTGGMVTKLQAAKIAMESNMDMIIANGKHPDIVYELLQGTTRCTRFLGKEQSKWKS